MARPFDALYLSPHLDDAALSCGGRIADRTGRGERVLVVTLFTADEPDATELSPLAAEVHRWAGLDGDVMARRRVEDLEACRVLGAEALHLGLSDAIYRRAGTGEPLYADLESLFDGPRPGDPTGVPEVVRALRRLPPAGELVAPLAVGGHVDHRLTREAAADMGRPLLYYEDYPYVARRGALRRALGRPAEWTARLEPLPEEALEAKVRACLAYASQVGPLFRSARRARRRILRHARRRGGERYWTRARPAGPVSE